MTINLISETHSSHLGLLTLGERTTEFYSEGLKKENTVFTRIACDFDAINCHLPNQFEYLLPLLQQALERCEKAGIRQLIIPNITLHEAYDRLTEELVDHHSLPPPIIHPVRTTINLLIRKKITRIVLIASAYTSESIAIKKQFSDAGIKVVAPTTEEINIIDNVRRLVYGYQESEKEIYAYKKIINYYRQKTVVVIACTELSIAYKQPIALKQPLPANIIDMSRVQIQAAIEKSQCN